MEPAELRTRCHLFAGLTAEEFDVLLASLRATRRKYRRGEPILRAGATKISVGIVLSGGALVTREDFWGRRMIMEHVPPGDTFAEAFVCAGAPSFPFNVIANEATEVLLIDYMSLTAQNTEKAVCAVHAHLLVNINHILAKKCVQLTTRMQCLSQHATRDKVLTFLIARLAPGSNTVEIPLNRQELADFLCVDRSALSRELGKMQGEGLLSVAKNRFTLHRHPTPA